MCIFLTDQSSRVCACVCVFLQSLVKSSWESRDLPTIIPQGVPYMVKLLRYYVSEDAVYLHLEHLKGEQLTTALSSVGF